MRSLKVLFCVFLSAFFLIAACSSAAPTPAPAAAKPAESKPAAEKAAEAKPVAKQAEAKSAEAKPAEKPAEAKPAAKADAKPAAPKSLPSVVAIGTAAVGGGFNAAGNGVAKVVSDHSLMKVLVKPFAGPNAWMPMLEGGELELGVLGTNDAGWAYAGVNGYDKPTKNLRVLVRGNDIPVAALVVRADSDIKSIKDLKGKRVSSEYGGSVSQRENVAAALESAGLTWQDVLQVPAAEYISGLRALREGKVDATFAGSTTLAATLEVDAAVPLRLLDIGDIPPDKADSAPKEIVERLQKRQPGAVIYRQKREGFLKSDATAFKFPNLLTASAKVSNDAAYEITRIVYEYDKELHPIHAWLAGWQQATMFYPDAPLPYHEGAIQFWKEKGLWTPATEATQKRLLGQ